MVKKTIFVAHLTKDGRHWKKTYKKHGKFDFHNGLKQYLRNIAKGENVGNDSPSDTAVVDPNSFVKFVISHLDEPFSVAI